MALIPVDGKSYWVVPKDSATVVEASYMGFINGEEVYHIEGTNRFVTADYISTDYDDAWTWLVDRVFSA